MLKDEDYSEILNILTENCNRSFHKTTQAQFLQEKRERMDENCKNLFRPGDLSFIYDCFGTICEIEGAKTDYAYVQGLKDCVGILKKLGAL